MYKTTFYSIIIWFDMLLHHFMAKSWHYWQINTFLHIGHVSNLTTYGSEVLRFGPVTTLVDVVQSLLYKIIHKLVQTHHFYMESRRKAKLAPLAQ